MCDEPKIKFKEELSHIESGTTVQFIVSNEGIIPHEFAIGNTAEKKEHEEMKHDMPGMTNADDNTVTIELGKAKTLTWLFAGSDAVVYSCNIPGPAGQGLNPPAPKLGESAAHMNPAELFWVTKSGIKMTGMPAWGATHGDEEIWPVVALLTALPQLDAEAYAALKHRAKGMGHHAHDEPAAGGKMHTENDDNKRAATADRSEPEPEPEHDHNAHSH